MALDNTTVTIPLNGHIYTAVAGTPIPASLTAPASPWAEIGHTSQDSPLTISRDGGDVTKKGTWQVSGLRTTVADVTYSVGFTALQLAEEPLTLYFGGGTVSSGQFWPPNSPAAQDRALFIRLLDRTVERPLYFPYVSFLGSDNIELDPEEFMPFPLNATILSDPDNVLPGLFAIPLPA